jgi:hypothetical protein
VAGTHVLSYPIWSSFSKFHHFIQINHVLWCWRFVDCESKISSGGYTDEYIKD